MHSTLRLTNWGRARRYQCLPKKRSMTGQLAIARGLAGLTCGTAVTVNSVMPGPTRLVAGGTHVFEANGVRYSIEKGGFKRMPGGVVHEAWLSPRLADPQIEESGWLVNGLHGGPSEDDIDQSPPPWSLRDEVADLREHRP